MIEDITIELHKFPSTRYQGSKRKLLPWIYDALKDVEFNTALDAFGGTAAVSYLFKLMGKQVTYNDYLKFNTIIGKSIIANSQIRLNQSDIKEILTRQFDSGNFIEKNFKNIYYQDNENQWLDKIIHTLYEIDLGIDSDYKRAIAFNAIFQACLIKRPFNLFHRKNLYIRLNDVKRNFGNKTTWERDFEYYFNLFISEINNSILDTGLDCYARNDDVFKMKDVEYDLVYLDPPYVLKNSKNESANYLRNYHFLEGISNYGEWQDNIDYNSRILNISNSYLSNHFKVSNIHKTFENLISIFSNSKIVISYKFGGLPSIEFIIDLLEKQNKTVTTRSMQYTYALNKQNGNAKLNREFLIIGI